MDIMKTAFALLLGAFLFSVPAAAYDIPKDLRGVLLYAPDPEFPYRLVSRGVQGNVTLLLKVNPKTGRVYEVKVLKSARYIILNELAAKSALQWRFRPGTITEVTVPYSFSVTGTVRRVY